MNWCLNREISDRKTTGWGEIVFEWSSCPRVGRSIWGSRLVVLRIEEIDLIDFSRWSSTLLVAIWRALPFFTHVRLFSVLHRELTRSNEVLCRASVFPSQNDISHGSNESTEENVRFYSINRHYCLFGEFAYQSFDSPHALLSSRSYRWWWHWYPL